MVTVVLLCCWNWWYTVYFVEFADCVGGVRSLA